LFLLLVQLTEHAIGQDLGEADDGVQRGAKLVRHVRQELGLVLAGDFELATLLLDLAEKPGVLDRQRRLSGERAEEVDCFSWEVTRLIPRNPETAYDAILVNHGYGEDRPDSGINQVRPHPAVISARKGDVGHLDGLPRDGRLPNRSFPLSVTDSPKDACEHVSCLRGCPLDELLGSLLVLRYDPTVEP